MDSKWESLLETDPENEDRDGIFLGDVWNMAAQHSTDPSTQVAAALVTWRGGIVLAAWNEVPPELEGKGYPKCLNTKNLSTEHAERRVLYKAVNNGIDVQGLQLYGTWVGCADCCRTIIQLGIKRVVTFQRLLERTPPKWQDSVQHGIQMMRDSGVQVIGWTGAIRTQYKIRFGGELLSAEDLL